MIQGGPMETFKKRQKAWARKEKQQKKAARRMERRNEKANSTNKTEENKVAAPELLIDLAQHRQ
jgi:hypothetical protein